MVEKQIQSFCEASGVYQFGYADISEITGQLAPSFPTAISFCIALSNGVMNEIHDAPTHTYFSLYRTVNRHIDQVSLHISTLLERAGFLAYMIPASQSIAVDQKGFQGAFSHRLAAHKSGLGFIGKNNSIVHPSIGPRLRLGTVLTTFIPDAYHKPLSHDVGCGSCSACVDNCPALALKGTPFEPGISREAIVDVNACSHYMHKHFQHIGRGSVCGLCIAICPYGGGK